jgi:hypothetical protein
MSRHKLGPAQINWLLAVGLPVVAAALSWPLLGATTSAHACATGQNGGGGIPVFAALVLGTPAVIAWRAWRAKERSKQAVLAATVGTFLALVLVYMTAIFWWSAHNCMT